MKKNQRSEERISNYADFWNFYLAEHSEYWNRRIHVFTTMLGTIAILSALFFGKAIYVPFIVATMYAVVWVAHFLIEKNKPATWKHPLWSFISDFRMTYLFLIGKLP